MANFLKKLNRNYNKLKKIYTNFQNILKNFKKNSEKI